jgi:hypothetical protein
MMALFQRAAREHELGHSLAAKTAERDKIAARVAIAEAAVATASSHATRLAIDGAADAVLDAAEGRLRAASDRAATLRSALIEAEATVVALDRDLAEHLDAKTRAATAVGIEAMAVDLDRLVASSDALFTKIGEIAGRAAAAEIWDGRGLEIYAQASKIQLPAAIAMVSRSLRERRDRVLDGRSPASLAKAPTLREIIPLAEPSVVRLFSVKPIKWTTPDGRVETMCKFVDVDLPLEAAERGLAIGACMAIDSDVRRQWAGSRPQSHPDPSICQSLDAGGTTDVIPLKPDTPSDTRFHRVDRGPPVILRIPREA